MASTKASGGAAGKPIVRDIPDPGPTLDTQSSATFGEAEAARIASGQPVEDATEAVEAEVPAENIAHIGDARLPTREEAAAAIERATAGLGQSKRG